MAITGVSRGGIGKATALAVAKHGPTLLILISRTQSNLDEVIDDIKAVKPHVHVESVLVDLGSQVSVRHGAEEVKSLTQRIDVLINNAGLTVYRREWSPDGLDIHLACNHLGPFLLTNLLLDRILTAAKASPLGATRVVNITSDGHRPCPFRFHDYNCEGKEVPSDEQDELYKWPADMVKPIDGYSGWLAYGQSKTANILFTVELNRRLEGTGVVSYAVYPGGKSTR